MSHGTTTMLQPTQYNTESHYPSGIRIRDPCVVASVTGSTLRHACAVAVNVTFVLLQGKRKVIPLHAMEALGVRGCIAPTHS
jgi:hypothetical protein